MVSKIVFGLLGYIYIYMYINLTAFAQQNRVNHGRAYSIDPELGFLSLLLKHRSSTQVLTWTQFNLVRLFSLSTDYRPVGVLDRPVGVLPFHSRAGPARRLPIGCETKVVQQRCPQTPKNHLMKPIRPLHLCVAGFEHPMRLAALRCGS